MHTMMTRVTMLRSVVLALMVTAGVLCGVSSLPADQAQYFYDELGRLIGVVDGQNNAAVYSYDEVGNLLSIQRFTSAPTGVGIFVVSPSSALVGAPVTIQGFGFSTTPTANDVKFNGTAATVISATEHTIVTTVPTGATTGSVTVTNANGAATSPQAFTVLVPPIITGVDPLRVPQGATSRIFVEGFNLTAASAVQFTQAGLTATIQSGATNNTLPVNLTVGSSVPSGLYGFSVTTPSGTTQSGTVKVEVRSALPGFNTTRVLTIKMPLDTTVPATKAPTGISFDVSPVTSVAMP